VKGANIVSIDVFLQKKKIPRDLKIEIVFPAVLLYGLLSETGLGIETILQDLHRIIG